ncbi:MAG: toprim domain-containing protein, partial [Mycoplasmatales bacterium]
GNAITYLQDKRNLSYQDGVAYLASKLNIQIKMEKKSEAKKEHILLGDVSKFYQTVLLAMKSGSIGREYLIKRGFDKQIIEKFNLGYASDDKLLSKYLENQITENNQYTNYEVENSNILYGNNEFFKKRLIIPIMNDEDYVVGFSGRSLGDNDPKYLNSKDSPIFQKKNILYNMNRAKKYINDETIIIVEGYFDVIALSLLGVNNVVAIMGTSFGIGHINLLKKYKIKKIILCLDQDEAGVKSTLKIGELLLKNGFSELRVVTYDVYKDIDEYINKNNSIGSLLETPKDYFEFKIDKFKKYYDIDTIDGKMSYLKIVLNGIQTVELQKQNIIKIMLSDIVGMDINKIFNDSNAIIPRKKEQLVEETYSDYDMSTKEINNNNYDYQPPVNIAPVEVKLTSKNKLPTDEDALVQYALIGPKNCHKVKLYVERENLVFVKHDILFKCLCEYYDLYQTFDMIEFMNVSHPNYFVDIIQKMQSNNYIDMEKVDLIFNNSKQRIAGINMFRKKKK